MYVASHESTLKVGDGVRCYIVVEKGKKGVFRMLSVQDVSKVLLPHVEKLSFSKYIASDTIKTLMNPTAIKDMKGYEVLVYDATLVIEVCENIMDAKQVGRIQTPEELALYHLAMTFVSKMAFLGINALVDEATGNTLENYTLQKLLKDL